MVLIVVFAMFTSALILPEGKQTHVSYAIVKCRPNGVLMNSPVFLSLDHFGASVLLFLSFCIVLMTLTIRFIVANGMHYVNWPKLVPLGYDLPVNQFANVSQDSKHAVTEIEMGWKNE